MSVCLRLVRRGRRHRPFFRLRAVDSKAAPQGRFIEELGFFDPIQTDADKQVSLKKERIEYWLGHGAQVSETVGSLLKKKGIGRDTVPATVPAETGAGETGAG